MNNDEVVKGWRMARSMTMPGEVKVRLEDPELPSCPPVVIVPANLWERVEMVYRLHLESGGGTWADYECDQCGAPAGQPCTPGNPNCRFECGCPTCVEEAP